METTMETTISYDRGHDPIGFGGAFGRQLGLLWTSRRPLLLLVAAVGILAVAGRPWAGGEVARMLMMWPVFVFIVGPLWAFAVLNNEGPSQRHYHWSQPVARHSHSLARIAAGAAWLWVAYAAVVAAAFAFAAAEGNADQLTALGGLAWVNLFTSPLLGYLAVSVLTLTSDYPVRWFLGIVFLVPVAIGLISEWLGLTTVAQILARPITDETWGLGITMVGAMSAGSSAVLRTVVGQEGVNVPEFAASAWAMATLFWVAGLAALVAVAAAVHPDRMPRLRFGRG